VVFREVKKRKSKNVVTFMVLFIWFVQLDKRIKLIYNTLPLLIVS